MAGTLAGCVSTPVGPEIDLIGICRRVGGIDVTPILGNRHADCGSYRIPPSAHRMERSQSLGCVLRAQSEGRAFIYRFEEIALPNVDYYELVVFGTRGERILLQFGSFGDQAVGFTGACEKLEVLEDGSIEHANCSADASLIERLKIAASAVNR